MARYYINKDDKNQYFWILKSQNGETVCMSSESYVSKDGAKKSINWTRANAKTTELTDLA